MLHKLPCTMLEMSTVTLNASEEPSSVSVPHLGKLSLPSAESSVSSGLSSNVYELPRSTSYPPVTSITEQFETNAEIMSVFGESLNNNETSYLSDYTVIQDTATELEGTRDSNCMSSFSSDVMNREEFNDNSSLLQQGQENLDYFIKDNLTRNYQDCDQSDDFGNVDNASEVFASSQISGSNDPTSFLSQICNEDVPEEVDDILKQYENNYPICPNSLNSNESESCISKCKFSCDNDNDPEFNVDCGSTSKMFDFFSSYVAVLDWNGNNIDLPEKLCDDEHEQVEIYIFDETDGTDGGDVNCFLQANENFGDNMPVKNRVVTSSLSSDVSTGCVQQDGYYEGCELSESKNELISEFKGEMNVMCDDWNVSLHSNGESNSMDLKQVKNKRVIKQELYDEDSEFSASLYERNSNVLMPAYSMNAAEVGPGQNHHLVGVSHSSESIQQYSSYLTDLVGREEAAPCSKNVYEVTPTLTSSGQDYYGKETCVNDSSSYMMQSDALLKTQRSSAECKRKAMKRRSKELCVKLSDDLIERDKMLKRLKAGKFGKSPHVVRITENGTLLDVSSEYLVHLPCRIRH